MTSPGRISLDLGAPIATLTIQRPEKLNALDRATLAEIGRAVRQIRDDDAVRGVIVTGSGEKAFAAGADIAELATLEPLEAVEVSRQGQAVFRGIERSRKPFVAAVNGFALGGGCELALACHLRLASSNARFGLPEVRLGIIPGYGGTVRLARLVGRGRALQLILTGEMVGAEEAARIGLVNEVLPPDELLPRARTLLEKVLENGPLAVAFALDAVQRGLDLPADDALAVESDLFGLLAGTEDMREGMAAFLEKRPPRFHGR